MALILVGILLGAGLGLWQRLHRTDLEQALGLLPASSLRVGFTDWDVVRQRLDADLGDTPGREAVEALMLEAAA